MEFQMTVEGGVAMINSNVTFARTIISGNSGSRGAGIYADNSTVNYNSSHLNSNSGANGGGMLTIDSNINFTGCQLNSNAASVRGGGIYALRSNVTFTDCNINSNTASRAAGVYGQDSNVTITRGTVQSNKSVRNGAVMCMTDYGYDKTLSINACTIQSNEGYAVASITDVNDSVDDTGATGAIYVRGNGGTMRLNADACWFDNNKGAWGAALRIQFATANITGCSFTSNRGFDINSEGNIYIDHYTQPPYQTSSLVKFDNCLISSNHTFAKGSAIMVNNVANVGNNEGIKLYVLNSSIVTNSGTDSTIWLKNGNTPVNGTFVNTTISGNTGNYGSAMSVGAATNCSTVAKSISCTITNNTFVNIPATNTKSGAVCVETTGAEWCSYNSIITGNYRSGYDWKSTNHDVVNHNNTGAVRHYRSFVNTYVYGSKYFDDNNSQNGEIAQFGHPFHPASMLAGLAAQDSPAHRYVHKLHGIHYTDGPIKNSAYSKGHSVAQLQTLVDGVVTNELIAKDQLGNARTGNIMGACVAGSGSHPASLGYVYFCGSNVVKLINGGQIANGASYETKELWSWTASFGKIDECKPVRLGSQLLVTSSEGYCALIDVETKTEIFNVWGYHQAHSADLLPNNRVAIACAQGTEGNNNLMFIFDIPTKTWLHYYAYENAHGVVWNTANNRMYALGSGYIHEATYDRSGGTIAWTKTLFQGASLHDLSWMTDNLMLFAGNGVTYVNVDTGALASFPFFNGHTAMKSVNYDYQTGMTWYTDATSPEEDHTWSTQTVHYMSNVWNNADTKVFKTPGINTYKVRVLHW